MCKPVAAGALDVHEVHVDGGDLLHDLGGRVQLDPAIV